MSPEDSGWDEYRRLVVKELEDRAEAQLRLEDKLSSLEKEFSALQAKTALVATILGAAASALVGFVK
jgi:hypothetical protein